MKQNDLNRAVAKATGETISTIKHLGFCQTDPEPGLADENFWEAPSVNWNEQGQRESDLERGCCEAV